MVRANFEEMRKTVKEFLTRRGRKDIFEDIIVKYHSSNTHQVDVLVAPTTTLATRADNFISPIFCVNVMLDT